jgi:hypothetical protein
MKTQTLASTCCGMQLDSAYKLQIASPYHPCSLLPYTTYIDAQGNEIPVHQQYVAQIQPGFRYQGVLN